MSGYWRVNYSCRDIIIYLHVNTAPETTSIFHHQLEMDSCGPFLELNSHLWNCPFGLEEEPSFPCSTVGQYFTKDDTAFCFTQDSSFLSPSLVSVLFSTTPSHPCQSSYLFDLCFTQSTVPVIPASHCEDICSPLLSNLWYQNSVIFFNNTCCLWNSMLPSFIS